jgi:formaldehyde-activating enzyme involved in methanogenesis
MLPHRTTFSLDDETIEGIRKLARVWGTSQAGVVRRAVADAVSKAIEPMAVAEVIARYETGAVPRSTSDLKRVADALREERLLAEESRLNRVPKQ